MWSGYEGQTDDQACLELSNLLSEDDLDFSLDTFDRLEGVAQPTAQNNFLVWPNPYNCSVTGQMDHSANGYLANSLKTEQSSAHLENSDHFVPLTYQQNLYAPACAQDAHDMAYLDLPLPSISETPSRNVLRSKRQSSKANEPETETSAPVSTRIFYRRSWTPKEDEKLAQLVARHGPTNWRLIAKELETGKNGNQCSQRWQKALDPNIVKGKWNEKEDEALRQAVSKVGFKWKKISALVPGRTGKQCRDRYTSKLNPRIHLGPWTKREEEIALKAHQLYGNKWAAIQKLLPDRAWYTIKWKIECLTKERLHKKKVR